MPPRPARAPTASPRLRSLQPQPADTPLDRSFTYRLHLLHKLTDQASQSRYLDGAGLSLSDSRGLTVIGSFGPLSVGELADRANLNKSQASRAAQALVDQGLVSKDGRDDDARGVVLALTPAGRRACTRALALVQQRNAEILGCLSAAEQSQLSALLDRLIAHNRALP
jgi:DNA-binding MarR family transcriptional regulator